MGQLDRLERSRSPGRMTNGAEGLIRKKDEGLTQQGLWMAAGKLLMCSFLWEETGQGPGVRECRAIDGNPFGRHSRAGDIEDCLVCSFVYASFVSPRV